MSTYESCILVIFRKGDTIKNPIIRFETYPNRGDVEKASMRVLHDEWTEIHTLTTTYPDYDPNVYYNYRGFTITIHYVSGNGLEYWISEKNGDITVRHAPVVGYRNAINYINKICYQRKFE